MDIVDIWKTHFENSLIPNLTEHMPFSRINSNLIELRKSFIFVPADKAANNVVIVWHKYHVHISIGQIVILKNFFFQNTPITETHIINKIGGRDRMVVRITTTHAIIVDHH